MNIYTVKSTDIVHNTSVDLITRWFAREVHIVQYDNSQPIVAVKLFKNSERFVLPDGYEANLRFGKKDRTFIYKPVLGCNQGRDTVYFAVDEQMSMFYGKVNPIIEFTYNGAVVGSSSIPFVIDRNPIQIGDVESKSDYPAIIERISAKQDKLVSGTNIKTINGNSLLGTGDITINVEDLNPLKANITALKADVSTLKTDNTQNKTNISNKQDTLVSGTNIKTINGESILGSGNIAISGGSGLASPWVSEEKCIGITDNYGYYSGLINIFGSALYGEVIYDFNSSDQPPLAACAIGASCEPKNDNLVMFSDNETNVNSYVKLPKDFKTRSQTIILGDITTKQDKLVSGTNIKTINGESILGSGNITISGGSGGSGSARLPLYSHTITLKNSGNSAYFAFTIYIRADKEVTKDTLFDYLNWNVCAGTGVASNALIDKITFNTRADSTWVHQFLELSGQYKYIDNELTFDSVFGTDFTVKDIVRGPDWIPPK